MGGATGGILLPACVTFHTRFCHPVCAFNRRCTHLMDALIAGALWLWAFLLLLLAHSHGLHPSG
jgi:hypothetical protein